MKKKKHPRLRYNCHFLPYYRMIPVMKVGFFAEKCLPFDALTLEERPLGGTETGIIRLAEALAELHHEVTVFTAKAAPRSARVMYRHAPEILRIASEGHPPFDVLVLVKDHGPALFSLPARSVWYLTGDGPDQYVNFGLGDKRVHSRLQGMFTVSEWHSHALAQESGFPIQKMYVLGNGVHLPYFEGEETRAPRRLIFTSAPYRGLKVAYLTFVELQKEFPDLELHIFAGFSLYDTENPFSGPLVQEYERLRSVMALNRGCVFYGNVIQRELAREYMRSSILFYPNLVPETCCIVALEAQAAGCPVIASNISALPETVREGGLVISGVPGSKEYISELLYTTRLLIQDRPLWERLSNGGREKVFAEYSWKHVAARFERVVAPRVPDYAAA